MAGEVVLSALLQAMLEKAFVAAAGELSLVSGVGQELSRLASVLRAIRSVLDDAESRQSDPAVRHWLLRLRSLSHAAEDALDLHVSLPPPRRRFLPLALLRFRRNLKTARRIRSIRAELEQIAREREILGLRDHAAAASPHRHRLHTSSLVDDSGVFGRSDDSAELLRFLLADLDCVSALSVVGMGGLGKTTLAQVVYNDPRARDYFQLRSWICVSEDLDVGRIAREIAEAVEHDERGGGTAGNAAATNMYSCVTLTNLNLVHENIATRIRGRRFLVVLDDAWSEDADKWEAVLSPLLSGARGSKVLVTTRSERVAVAVKSRRTYRLGGLSDDDCWRLFQRWAFPDGDSAAHPRLEEIGREIVRKLKGFPLAAKTIGSLLYSKFDEDDWYRVLRSEIWELQSPILPALRLSYRHLPPHLKQCFVYCSVFHKDYVFAKEDLARIWIALGYVLPRGGMRPEDVAAEYFDDLLSRSFFQRHGENYVMHDMVHDLARAIAAEECLRMEEDANEIRNDGGGRAEMVRHLSFSCADKDRTVFEHFYDFRGLRTLLLLRGYKSLVAGVPEHLFRRLRCLRVLVLRRRNMTVLPSSIGRLRQLRYLNLAGSSIESLPDSVSALYNLQTLKLKNCVLLDSLPPNTSRLVNLRHLEATPVLIATVGGIGKLSSLQSLEEYFILDRKGHRIDELRDMAQLRGKLCIRNLENVKNGAEAREARMGEKPCISILELLWAGDRLGNRDLSEEILEGLRPHPNLKELKISCYCGRKLPSWTCSKVFLSLRSVSLSNCSQCESLPSLGQLPYLEYLLMEGMGGITQISGEFYGGGAKGFPSLKALTILDMPHLEEWHDQPEVMSFPVLSEFVIEDCSRLRSLPVFPPKLASLRISGVGMVSVPGLRGREELQGSPSAESVLLSASLPCISSLYISNCPNLTSLAEGLMAQELVSLEDLTIGNCGNLISLPPGGFRNYISLKNLNIYHCEKLVFSSVDRLLPSSLHDLRICSSFLDSDAQILSELENLSSLKHIEFADCPGIIVFPEKLSASLELLRVSDCAGLQNLPTELQLLSSLRSLIIINCPKMEQLPRLPLQLQELFINNCPLLKSRYREGIGFLGEILHVPKVYFDEERLPYSWGRRWWQQPHR